MDTELNERFSSHGARLDADVLHELQSILRLHDISPQELFYKWESYSMKMGGEPLKMELKTARDLKRDIQDVLERETRGKAAARTDKRIVGGTPRSTRGSASDAFGMMEGVVHTPRAPMAGIDGNSAKRKSNFETPAAKTPKSIARSSPSSVRPPHNGEFSKRSNPGVILETLNGHIKSPKPPLEPALEPRIALKAYTEIKKYAHKNMAVKVSEASEVLDDRIDEVLALIQAHHQLDDGAFGNPAIQSPSEFVAVGRIASDSGSGKLNQASIVLETSRRTGAGVRVPLKLDAVPHFEMFPGKIVALRGKNVTGLAFTVSEILDLPRLPLAATSLEDLTMFEKKLAHDRDSSERRPLNIITGAGPYTDDSNLDYEPLRALCSRAEETRADALILLGPFVDTDHPLIVSGQFSTANWKAKNDEEATLNDAFQGLFGCHLIHLTKVLPGIVIVMVPSTRDAISSHPSWPQDKLPRKELGLPKQCVTVPNPVTLALNEVVFGLSSQDVLYEMRPQECVGGSAPLPAQDALARLSSHIIEQRHFFPLYPPCSRETLPRPSEVMGGTSKAIGTSLDLGYLALGEWQTVQPDVLITPSALNSFAKVVEGMVVVNPGSLSKKRAPGTFAQLQLRHRELSEEEIAAGEPVGNRVFQRARVDVVRI